MKRSVKGKTLAALLAESTTQPKRSHCWFEKAEMTGNGDLIAFLDAVTLEKTKIVYPRVSEILAREFDLRAGPNVVGIHFKGQCSCGKISKS